MQSFQDKVCVITGAGSGIGRQLALQLASTGARLALNDWSEETLGETTEKCRALGATVHQSAFSVANREAVYRFAQTVAEQYGQVDLVVNNAGIALMQRKIESTPYEEFEKIIDINLWGVIYGSKAFLPHLKERPEAALVNVSSIFGQFAYPNQGPYVTTKFAVKGFTEVLRQELARTNVAVSVVQPGGIATNIINNIDTDRKEWRQKFASTFNKMAGTTAEEAARTIIKGIQRKKKRILIGRDARLADRIIRLLPSSYEKILLRKYDVDRFSQD